MNRRAWGEPGNRNDRNLEDDEHDLIDQTDEEQKKVSDE